MWESCYRMFCEVDDENGWKRNRMKSKQAIMVVRGGRGE